MTSRRAHRRDLARQGVDLDGVEEFAESWALRMEEIVWPRYKEFFGARGKVRLEPPSRPQPAAGALLPRLTSEVEDLLARAAGALSRYPQLAFRLTERLALHHPGEGAAARETIALQALVRLARNTEAERRARDIVERDPTRGAELEAVLGRPLT